MTESVGKLKLQEAGSSPVLVLMKFAGSARCGLRLSIQGHNPNGRDQVDSSKSMLTGLPMQYGRFI
jgi:hypothetical protein